MAWPGGKNGAGIAQRLINEIPPHDLFVSPFLGDCAVLRRKRPAAASVGIDLDRPNVERWAARADVPGLQLYCCDGIEWLRFRFGWYQVAETSDGARVTAAGVAETSGPDRAAFGPDRAGGEVALSRGRRPWPHNPAAAAAVAGNGDGRSTDVIDAGSGDAGSGDVAGDVAGHAAVSGGGGPRAFVYADPPYLMSSRRSRRRLYAHELDEEGHGRLLKTVVALPCNVMVSHYPCGMYRQALAGWRTFTFAAQTRGGRSIEQVWCNYPPPVELHDARYLGRDKRQRERIRRRVRNWTNGLARMAPLERQAVLDAIGRFSAFILHPSSFLKSCSA